MTTKVNAEKQKGKSTPTMEVKKNEASKTASTKKPEVKQPTVEELQKKVKELTSKLNSVPNDLQSKIEYFNKKRELIRKLTNLENNVEQLQQHLDALAEISAANEFDNDNYVLKIEGGETYRKEEVFKLKNPVLIGEVLTYLIGKAKAKIDELENEIAA